LLKKYKILANECLFVDDKDKNCKVADVVWMKTVLAKNPRQTIRDIKELLKI
jgi:FMN phosphatase YigB (HAD superfamily)